MKKGLIVVLICAMLFLVIGVDSCPMPGAGGGNPSKSGLDFSLIQGVSFFASGAQLEQGETFKIALKLENFDKTEKQGTACVKDDKEYVYGGISEDCMPFYLKAAEYNQNTFVKSSSTELYFPSDGEYSYHDIPIAQSAKIFVTFSYLQHSLIQGTVNAPVPAAETIKLIQTSAPISASVDKTVSKQEDQYKTNLGITLTQISDPNLKVYSEDMKSENKIKFSTKLLPSYNLDCQQGIIDFASTKLIKCSTLLSLEQVGYPFVINLDYGVTISKTFDFSIKAKEETK